MSEEKHTHVHVLEDGTVIEHSVIMGADHYEREGVSGVKLGVGRDCFIKNAIVDKNARIGDGSYISPEGKADVSTDLYTIHEGVIVIPKNAVIPPGFRV